MLVVKPRAIIFCGAGIADPLTEPFSHGGEVVRIGSPVCTAEIVDEMRVRADEAVPDIQYLLDLILEHLTGHPKISEVIIGEEDGLLEQVKFLLAERRLGDFRRTVGIT